jgi:hypothetical protein
MMNDVLLNGAISGGAISGAASQFIGRRLTIM